jgi:hypothetical protein
MGRGRSPQQYMLPEFIFAGGGQVGHGSYRSYCHSGSVTSTSHMCNNWWKGVTVISYTREQGAGGPSTRKMGRCS